MKSMRFIVGLFSYTQCIDNTEITSKTHYTIHKTARFCDLPTTDKNSSGDEIANVNFFYNIAHVEASAYAH